MNPFDSKHRSTPWMLPCLYCGVDSGPVLGFFVWIVGAGLLAFLSLLIWGRLSGKFSSDQSSSTIPLDCELPGVQVKPKKDRGSHD